MGAWIETRSKRANIPNWEPSHPVWVRGLKQFSWANDVTEPFVAPRVGAWIETQFLYSGSDPISQSHPVWVRGLKLPVCSGVIRNGNGRTPCGCVD